MVNHVDKNVIVLMDALVVQILYVLVVVTPLNKTVKYAIKLMIAFLDVNVIK